MLRAAAEAACSVAYCTPAGEVQWTDEGSDERQVEEFLGELAGFEGSEVGVQRLDVGSGRVVLHACLGEEEAQAVGRLAVLLEPGSQEEEIVRVADALSDVAVCIERGQRLNREANDLAQELANRYEELNLLYSLGGHVRAFEEGSVGAQALLHNLSERLAVDFAAFVPSRDGEPIYADRMVKPMPNRDLVLTAIRGDLLRFACTAGKAVILNDPIDPRRPYLLANMPYRVLACPVVDCGPSDALLVLLRSADGPEFTNGDRSLAMVIANQTAIMMQNNAMLTSLQKFGVQMAGALIEAVEAKDPYTRGHSERVQRICIDLGKSLELSASSIQDISWGALLHDVGKIGVPDHIICKAGTLTQDEYTMIKIHPERSYEILRHIEDLSLGALAAARHHHEALRSPTSRRCRSSATSPVPSWIRIWSSASSACGSTSTKRRGRPTTAAMAELERSRIGVATHLFPEGPLSDAARLDALRDALTACLTEGELQLVVDLSDVPLLSGEALEALLDAQDQLARVGGSLKVAHANELLEDVLRLTEVSARVAVLGERAHVRRSHPAGPGRRIGEILVERGYTTAEMVEKALDLQGGARMAQVMLDKGWVQPRDLLECLGIQLGLPLVRLRPGLYDPDAVRRVAPSVARRLRVLPLFVVRGVLYFATADPQSIPVADTLEDLTGLRVKPVLAVPEEIERVSADAHGEVDDLAEYVGNLESDLELVETRGEADEAAIDEMAAGNPVISLINGVIQRAIRDRASDIHIEPSRTQCRIRLRVDGLLYPIMSPAIDVHPALVSRLKVMAELDISERRLPQDGRIQVVTGGRKVDLRFSSLPGIFGEKVVLRVLDKNESFLDVEQLGFRNENKGRLTGLLERSYGLILVTGPTGSGKTTTLYAGINYLTSPEKNIVTIEDPVEYQIDSITQNQVRENIGLSFARILKHVLRQDPDIIMVGEIRERETAEIAVQAALTGHLVLSTLHTNDSIGAVTRLLDMGVEPFLLSSALIGVVAQRLVRRVCPDCKTSYVAPSGSLEQFGVQSDTRTRMVRGRGCTNCYDSGYKGRMAIHEILETDADLQQLIVANANAPRSELDEHIASRGIKTLLNDGIERALEGQTTVEEVVRIVNS
jgi:type IV pilus assembly protein PilB